MGSHAIAVYQHLVVILADYATVLRRSSIEDERQDNVAVNQVVCIMNAACYVGSRKRTASTQLVRYGLTSII